MDVIKHGLAFPHTSLERPKEVLSFRKFAKFNLLSPSRALCTREAFNDPGRSHVTTAELSSSTDYSQKGRNKGTEEQDFRKSKQEQRSQGRKAIKMTATKILKDLEPRAVSLEKLAYLDASTVWREVPSTSQKHRRKLLWEELQGLAKRGTAPPQWYCFQDAQNQPENAPLFLCLPDIISNGLSLALHQDKLARLFEVRRLHVPINDTTTTEDLIKLIERTIILESSLRKGRPVYLMGEGYGALLAISLAARNPDLDLVLVLVDPATWCDERNVLPPVVDVFDAAPGPVSLSLPFLFSATIGDPVKIAEAMIDPSLPQFEKSQHFLSALRDVLLVLATALVVWSRDVCPRKVNQLQLAARSAVLELKNVKADVLLLSSGKEQNKKEAVRLKQSIPAAVVRYFGDRHGSLLLEEGVELVSLIKATNMYRRSKPRNIVSDYVPPSEEEKEVFRKVHLDIMKQLFSPVYFNVKEDGSVKRGLPRITKERPVLLICNHTFVGFDLGIIVGSFMENQDIMIRSLAHPLLTSEQPGQILAPSALPDLARLVGCVPVTGSNLYKLLAANETAFLLPGGVREAVKRKSYKLIWPAKPEFVRTAIRHGAVIIPMAAVGGDDFIQIVVDQQQMFKLPVIGEQLSQLENQIPRARQHKEGVEAEGHIFGTLGIPRPPPRMYFAFQKSIYTHDLHDCLNDKEVVKALYKQVKDEIEAGLSYLLKKRNDDPYQDFVPRILYEKTWGRQAPTFTP